MPEQQLIGEAAEEREMADDHDRRALAPECFRHGPNFVIGLEPWGNDHSLGGIEPLGQERSGLLGTPFSAVADLGYLHSRP